MTQLLARWLYIVIFRIKSLHILHMVFNMQGCLIA